MINWLEKNKTISLVITFLIIMEIFYFSSLSFGGGGGGSSWIPVTYHFVIFFLLGFFTLITLKGNRKIEKKFIIITILITISYAILDELHQLFVPFRSSSIQDILTDSLGIASSIIIYWIYNKKIQKEKQLEN